MLVTPRGRCNHVFAQARHRQSQGEFGDRAELFANAHDVSYTADFANYIGPVRVRRIAGAKGRGLFTTRAVAKGQLLIAERAFAHTLGDPKTILMSVDPTDRGRDGTAAGASVCPQALPRPAPPSRNPQPDNPTTRRGSAVASSGANAC